MNKLLLNKIEHTFKVGNQCEYIEPTVYEDTLLYDGDELIGFYIKIKDKKTIDLLNLANHLFKSDDVPKAEMQRPKMMGYDENGKGIIDRSCKQYSTILGSIVAKPHMRRNYPNISSVHSIESAKPFIKAMLMLCEKAEQTIKEIMPIQFEVQEELLKKIQSKWRFGTLFTSSISNYNIAAPYHRDTANISRTVNAIFTKRLNAKGGCLNVPDYGATFEQADCSLLVYPAWRNIHGVTPIISKTDNGYRNSLIFYPLSGFEKYND